MKTRILSLLPLAFFCLVAPVWTQEEVKLGIPTLVPNPGKLFIVKHTGDSDDASPGDGICADSDGNCTLRAAVEEVNANGAAADVIIFELAYPAVIELTRGELVLSDAATSIIGPGARRLTIRRSADTAPFRIFNVTNAEHRGGTRLWRLRLEGGSAGELAGGAVRVTSGTDLDLREIWFSGNTAGNGGAISSEGTLRITRSLFSDNSSTGAGGAMHLAAGSSTTLTNSTLTANSSATGGAIYAAGSLLSVNNTISHNSATTAASSIASVSGASVSTLNTIIGMDSSLPITTISGAFTSLGNNLITDARMATGFTNGSNGDQVSDNNSIDPLLGPLSDNGGQTDTRALIAGSPAINQGNSCVYFDQCSVALVERLRWDQRTKYVRMALSGGSIVDIGAFESGSSESTSGVGLGAFFPNNSPRNVGFVFAINATTGERKTAIVQSRGSYSFTGLVGGEVYVFDHHIKNRPRGPFIFALQF